MMTNEMKLFCTLPKGVIIKDIAITEATQQIVACTNKGVYIIDRDGSYKSVVAGPLPKDTVFTFSGMEING